VAAQWATRAQPGDAVRISGPRAWYRPPADAAWQVLVADLAGLPAVARILDQGGPLRTEVLVEVPEEGDLAALPRPAGVTVETVVGSGNGLGPSVLAERVEALTPAAGPGYLWFAGEATQARLIRKHARGRWGWAHDRLDVIGYWRWQAERWNARFERVADEMYAVYQGALEEGRSEREATEVYDAALEEAGL
jgi:NADPH-dependent ferric siderophore reductase